MINLKKYFKLLKYGLQIKTMVILFIAFFALGIFFEFIGYSQSGLIPFSGLYLGLSGMYIHQIVISSSLSSLVQVSSLKKKLQSSIPTAFTTCSLMITFTVFVILRLCYTRANALKADPAADTTIYYVNILATACMIAFVFLYFAFSSRYYIVSTVVLCIILIPVLVSSSLYRGGISEKILSTTSQIIDSAGAWVVVVMSYAVILIGALFSYIISLALYRKPLSNIAFRNAMRQAQAK